MKLFVYGTLRKGYWNNRRLTGANFLGQAITLKPYILWNGGFPIATHNQRVADLKGVKMLPVAGELYEVDETHIRSCDQLEGHPDWYNRTLIQCVTIDNTHHDTFIYEMNSHVGREVCDTLQLDIDKYYRWAG